MTRLVMRFCFICIMGTAGYLLGLNWGEGGVLAWGQLFAVAGVLMALTILLAAHPKHV